MFQTWGKWKGQEMCKGEAQTGLTGCVSTAQAERGLQLGKHGCLDLVSRDVEGDSRVYVGAP